MKKRPTLKAIKEDSAYTDFSDYALQLKQYLEFFSLETIYTLTFESLIANPEEETKKLSEILGRDIPEWTSLYSSV